MKLALVANKNVLLGSTIDGTFGTNIIHPVSRLFNAKTHLADRAFCENDNSLVQLIPYITLYDTDTKKIFVYQRGEGSNEGRLTGKCSLGLGGHIEEEPSENRTLIEVIADASARELDEEVGIKISTQYFIQRLENHNFGLVYDNTDEVGRHHLAIMFFVPVNKNDIKRYEKNVIMKGQWLSLDEIKDSLENDHFEFEKWSNIVIDVIKSFSVEISVKKV